MYVLYPDIVHTICSSFLFSNYECTFHRYCLWIIGNGETLMNSGSIWEVLVVDAIGRGCFHSVDEDERLSHFIATAMIDLGQVRDLLNTNSLLFRKARWKVCCLILFVFYFIIKDVIVL